MGTHSLSPSPPPYPLKLTSNNVHCSPSVVSTVTSRRARRTTCASVQRRPSTPRPSSSTSLPRFSSSPATRRRTCASSVSRPVTCSSPSAVTRSSTRSSAPPSPVVVSSRTSTRTSSRVRVSSRAASRCPSSPSACPRTRSKATRCLAPRRPATPLLVIPTFLPLSLSLSPSPPCVCVCVKALLPLPLHLLPRLVLCLPFTFVPPTSLRARSCRPPLPEGRCLSPPPP